MSFNPFDVRKPGRVQVDQVFGVQRNLPMNYVERINVDSRLATALQQKQHIVIYGSSKQGKTSLRRWFFKSDAYILISCVNLQSVEQMHLAILKEAGYEIRTVEKTTSGSTSVRVSIGANWPGGINPNIEWQDALTDQVQVSSRSLELNPNNVNDVIAALRSINFAKLIILEDYHYLQEDVQAEFARQLKAYYDYSDYCFIVIGVWLDEYRLVRFAGDLRERTAPISVDTWSRDQLSAVIERGEELLGINFDEEFKDYTLDHCFDSVWVVQRVCNRACIESGVSAQVDEPRQIGSLELAEKLIGEVVDDQKARSQGFIDGFSVGPVYESRTIFKWITFALLASDPVDLERGLELDDIKRFADDYYLDGYIDLITLRMSLEQVTWFQMSVVKISPIVIDYDRTARRLNVVDKEFLIWLSGQDRGDLLKDAGMPANSMSKWALDVNQPARHLQGE